MLLAACPNTDRIWLYVEYEKPLSPSELGTYRDAVRKRASRMPVAYITGRKEFMSGQYQVTPSVLIPRPETELLLEAIYEYLRKAHLSPGISIDLGTGSGVLAIELAKAYETLYVYAVDISSQALDIAKVNAARHGVQDRVSFVCGDLFAPLEGLVELESCELVVSNPPYIVTSDIDRLQQEISKFEPRIALDGGEDGLEFYRRISCDAGRYLRSSGVIAFEVGAGQAEAVVDILVGQGYTHIVVSKDYANTERVVIGQKG